MRDPVAPARRARFVLRGEWKHEAAAAALDRLDRLYRRLVAYYDGVQPPTVVELVWQQRPPLAAPLLRETLARQRDTFSGPTGVDNLLQIALDALSVDLAELCAESGDGGALAAEVSIPLYEGSADRDAADALLWRAEELLARGVRLRCSTVISKANHERIDEIVGAYRRHPTITGYRLVPLLAGAPESGGDRDGHLDAAEAVAALARALDCGGGPAGARSIEPLRDFLARLDRHRDPTLAPSFFSRRLWDPHLVVDEWSVLRGLEDAQGREDAYGDLERDDLATLLAGAQHLRAVAAAERRMAVVCARCRYFGGCDGEPVAEAAEESPADCAVVSPLLEHMERRLLSAGAANGSTASSARRNSDLQAGARLFLLVDSPDHRLTLSSGTAPPPAEVPFRYHVGAIVPREPWRPATPEQQRTLVADGPPRTMREWRPESSVALISLPESAIAPLREVCRECGLFGDDGPLAGVPHDRHPGWKAAHQTLLDHLRPYLLDGRPVDATTFYRGDPGQRTVTRTDRDSAQREALTGLHVDSWEGTPLRQRTRIRNRMCVNLGDEDRHFLYVNLTLDQMMRAAGLRDGDDVRLVNLFVGRRFFARFPDYPVVRVRVAPGEAYIAPTGNLVHDGDSLEKKRPDLALHLLGWFGIAADAVNCT